MFPPEMLIFDIFYDQMGSIPLNESQLAKIAL